MSVRDLKMTIMDEIERGELSFADIASKYDLTYDEVDDIAEELREYYADEDYEYDDDRYDDDMDGDEESALASAGWGVDEDYVMDNDYFDDY